ncbi:hypothetical protein BGX30_007551 [Mortierella sp. GBA39]|nr:hypothetical protein BGX30_007551 [Mortierella sp. GBA39]
MIGLQPIAFMQEPEWFRFMYISSGIWQGIGWGSIIYLASIANIDPTLYDAARIDGAGRWKQTLHITLTGIMPTIVIMFILNIGSMLSVGSEKIILMYNPITYETADVISTYVYRKGILGADFGYTAAVGLFNSVISFILIAYKAVMDNPMILTGYRNTIFYVAGGTAINLFMTTLGAYALSRRNVYFSNSIMFMIVITMVFNGGLIPSFLLVNSLGMLDTPWALLLPGAVSSFNLIIMRTAFQAVPVSLEESARIDGANDWTIMSRIIVPLSMPVIAVMILWYAVGHWNSYFSALIYLRDRELFPLQLVLREILISNSTDSMTTDAAASDRLDIGITINFDHLTYEEWRKQMISYHSQAYLPAATLQRNSSLKNDPMKVITFMQSLPVEDTSTIKGSLVVLIDEAKIHEMTRKIESANGSSVYIVDQNHELISSTPGASPLSTSILNELKSNTGLLNTHLNGQDVMVSFTTSEQVGWYYIDGAQQQAIPGGKFHPRKAAGDEFDYIMEMMKVSWDEERSIKNKLTQQLPLLRSNYLHRVLQGYYEPPEQMKQSLEFMGIQFPFPHFAVILVQVDDLTRFAPNQNLEKNRLALVVNLLPDQLGHPACRVKDIVSELHRILETRFKLEISIAISGVHEGQHQIGEAYLEAAAALEYRMVNGQLSIFYYQDIRQQKLQYYYPVETELQLINCVRSGDKEQVVLLLKQLFDMNFSDESITPELGRCLLFSLASTLLRIMTSDTPAYRRLTEGDIHP